MGLFDKVNKEYKDILKDIEHDYCNTMVDVVIKYIDGDITRAYEVENIIETLSDKDLQILLQKTVSDFYRKLAVKNIFLSEIKGDDYNV